MTRQRMLEEWNKFSAAAIHRDAPPEQKLLMRRAFYAGAFSFMAMTMSQLSPGPALEPGDERLMQEVDDELKEFFRGVIDGRN